MLLPDHSLAGVVDGYVKDSALQLHLDVLVRQVAGGTRAKVPPLQEDADSLEVMLTVNPADTGRVLLEQAIKLRSRRPAIFASLFGDVELRDCAHVWLRVAAQREASVDIHRRLASTVADLALGDDPKQLLLVLRWIELFPSARGFFGNPGDHLELTRLGAVPSSRPSAAHLGAARHST